MSLPVEEMISVGAAIAGLDLTPPKDALVDTPTPDAITKLQRLHAAAGQLAEEAPEIRGRSGDVGSRPNQFRLSRFNNSETQSW